MKSAVRDYQPRTFTLAELCEALANGTIPAQVEDEMYVVTNRDLMRFSRPRVVQMPQLETASRLKVMQAS